MFASLSLVLVGWGTPSEEEDEGGQKREVRKERWRERRWRERGRERGWGVGGRTRSQDLAQDQDVRVASDWIWAGEDRPQEAVRVIALGLAGTGSVEGPHGEGRASRWDGLLDDLGLGPHLVEDDVLLALETVVPNVLGLLGVGVARSDGDDLSPSVSDLRRARRTRGRVRGERERETTRQSAARVRVLSRSA